MAATIMFELIPARINMVPLHPYSSETTWTNGENISMPIPMPDIVMPVAMSRYFTKYKLGMVVETQ